MLDEKSIHRPCVKNVWHVYHKQHDCICRTAKPLDILPDPSHKQTTRHLLICRGFIPYHRVGISHQTRMKIGDNTTTFEEQCSAMMILHRPCLSQQGNSNPPRQPVQTAAALCSFIMHPAHFPHPTLLTRAHPSTSSRCCCHQHQCKGSAAACTACSHPMHPTTTTTATAANAVGLLRQ
jgi:hypothetical protein